MTTTTRATSTTSTQMVEQLMAVERQPLTVLQTKQSSYQTKISSLGKVSSALDALKTAISNLKGSSGNGLYTATSDTTDTATASVTGSAKEATYDLNITQLAKAQKLASQSFSSTNSVVGSGTLTFSINGKSDQSINISSGATLTDLRDAINSNVTGVKAAIVPAADGYKLSLTSATGESSAVTIKASDSDGNNTDTNGLSVFAYDPSLAAGSGKNMVQSQVAQDTKGTIDGIDIKSSTTQYDIQGISIQAKKVGTATITVGADSSTYATNAQAFVDAYNKVLSTLKSEGGYNATTGASGTLNGSYAVRAVSSALNSIKQTQFSGDIKNLTDFGISSNSDGTLKLDKTVMNKALSNPDAVTAFWSNNEFVGKATNALTDLTSVSGAVGQQNTSYNNSIKQLDTQIERMNNRLDMIQKRYTQQYAALDAYTNTQQTLLNLFA